MKWFRNFYFKWFFRLLLAHILCLCTDVLTLKCSVLRNGSFNFVRMAFPEGHLQTIWRPLVVGNLRGGKNTIGHPSECKFILLGRTDGQLECTNCSDARTNSNLTCFIFLFIFDETVGKVIVNAVPRYFRAYCLISKEVEGKLFISIHFFVNINLVNIQ